MNSHCVELMYCTSCWSLYEQETAWIVYDARVAYFITADEASAKRLDEPSAALPNEASWLLLMSAIVALGPYSDAVFDMALRRAGKVGGSGLLVSPTFESRNRLLPGPGVFVVGSPGLGIDLNPILSLQVAAKFAEMTQSGMWDCRYGHTVVTHT